MRISEQGEKITNRYFLALHALKTQKAFKSLSEFTDRHGINRGNMLNVRAKPEISVLKPEWIYYLCKDYNVSLDWIFSGEGDMFCKDKQ